MSLSYSNAECTLKVLLTFNKVEKTKRKISILFIFFFLDRYNSTTIWCMQILCIPNNCSATGHLPFLVWGGAWFTTGGLRPKNCFQGRFMFSVFDFWGFCSIILTVAHIVRPHLDYWIPATTFIWLSWSLNIVLFIYSALKTVQRQLKTSLYFYIPFESPQRDSTRFGGK